MSDKNTKECTLAVYESDTGEILADVFGSPTEHLRVVDDGHDSLILSFTGSIAASIVAWQASEMKTEVRVSRALLKELVKSLAKTTGKNTSRKTTETKKRVPRSTRLPKTQ